MSGPLSAEGFTLKIIEDRIEDESGADLGPRQPSDQITDDASSIEQFNEKRDTQGKQAWEDRQMLQYLFSTEAGRRFLWSIIDPLHPFTTAFATGPVGFPDTNATFYQLGQQQAGLAMYQKWHAAHPAETAAMLRENDVRLKVPVAAKKRAQRKNPNG